MVTSAPLHLRCVYLHYPGVFPVPSLRAAYLRIPRHEPVASRQIRQTARVLVAMVMSRDVVVKEAHIANNHPSYGSQIRTTPHGPS